MQDNYYQEKSQYPFYCLVMQRSAAHHAENTNICKKDKVLTNTKIIINGGCYNTEKTETIAQEVGNLSEK